MSDPGIVPGRITLALDARGLYGPQVDVACGAAEPDVDHWELGISTPSPEQVVKLAELTGFPVAFFYKALEPAPMVVTICHRKGRPRGKRCEQFVSDGIPVPPAAEGRRARDGIQPTMF